MNEVNFVVNLYIFKILKNPGSGPGEIGEKTHRHAHIGSMFRLTDLRKKASQKL
jgi:hypothetical protein